MSRILLDRTVRVMSKKVTRRSFLSKTAMVGSAMLTAPLEFILKPVSAYAAVCGPAAECHQGYTVFCCTVNRGVNKCPPNTFVGGWWKASGSSYCCDENGNSKARYYIDCHPRCECENGCNGSSFCSTSCVNCKCRCNTTTATCDRRRVCCNIFRYGQCHTEIGCSGGVACRVVTCTPPYLLYDSCGATVRTDNFTAQQTAPCLAGPCT